MDFIIPLLYFLLANGFFVILFKENFGKCIPITLMVSSFTYFISQFLFSTFKYGFIINLLIAISFIIILIIQKIKQKNINEFKVNYLSTGFYIFVAIYFLIYIFYYNNAFTTWDEFSHWGYMIKGMLKYDSFYTECLLDLNHRDYPPIIQLFELFYVNLSLGFKEAYLTRSIHLLSLSLFIPAICNEIKNSNQNKENKIIKNFVKGLLISIVIFLTLLFFDQHKIINTIYIDYLIAIICAYLLYLVFLEKELFSNFFLINLSIGFSFLLLTKQISICFYLMILFLYFGRLLIEKKIIQKINKNYIINIIKIIILLCIIPLFIWLVWDKYIEQFDLYQQFNMSDIKVNELIDIIKGNGGLVWQQTAFKNFSNAFFNKSITTSYITLSYIQAFIFAILLLLGVKSYFKINFNKKNFTLLLLTLIICFLGYAFVMMLTYVFCFGEREGPNLASFNRYMVTYILICISFVIMIFIKYNHKNEIKTYLLVIGILIIMQSSNVLSYCIPKIRYENTYSNHISRIINNTEDNTSIYIVSQGDTYGDTFSRLRFYLFDNRIVSSKYRDLKEYDVEIYQNKIEPYILQFDYIYIFKTDEILKTDYQFLFGEKIKNGNIYKIIKEDNKVRLELVNE